MCIYLRNTLLLHPSLTFIFKRNSVTAGILKWKKNVNRAPASIFNYQSIKNYCSTEDNKIKPDFNSAVSSPQPLDSDGVGETEFARFTIFNDMNNDFKIKQLNACASAEDVLKFIDNNLSILNDKYITQIVLVLCDLQVIFCKVSQLNAAKANIIFLQKLVENKNFTKFLSITEESITNFDPNLLGHTLVYLSKLGIPVEAQIIQNMCLKLKEHLMKKFSSKYAAQLFKVTFKENSVRPYYIVMDIVPQILANMESCSEIEDLLHLTTCMNRMNPIVTITHLEMYKAKVNEMIDNTKITAKNVPLLLKILLFLNYPQWRERNSLLISRCILLMKDSIDGLSVGELEILYDVFFKNQEPGEALNSIQRSSARHLQELEDSDDSKIDIKLKFFASLIYFCSPTHRTQFRKNAGKYITECDDITSLVSLRKIYSYLKISDENVCWEYWKKILKIIKSEETSLDNITELVDNYMHFYIDIDYYRHYEFEVFVFKFIKQKIKDDSISLYPDKFFALFNFAIANVRNEELIIYFMKKFKQLRRQLSPANCLKISQTLNLVQYDRRRKLSDKHLNQIKIIVNKASKDIFEIDQDANTVSKLMRGAIYRNDTENDTFEEIIQTYKRLPFMSSKTIENLCHMFLSTSILIPEVINDCTEYVVNNKSNLLGFNAEKLLFICYFLNYYPVNNGKFFDAVTDIILRDHERLSGLAFIQSVMSLCYFGRVSKSLVKQVFNVEFLDKLDVELANCYSRDIYPQRVRTTLMQLNRAVCLEFPEYHVPWFHQKYVEEIQRYTIKDDLRHAFYLRVKDYLVGVLGKDFVTENIVTPYGYNIDFVINLDSENQPLSNTAYTLAARKLALLLWTETKYTRLYTHLKGKYQMQIRHLEILGYNVKVIKLNEWMNLLYAKERIDFIKSLVFK